MKQLILMVLCLGVARVCADQTGAEAVKTPVAAKVIGARTIADWEGDPVGDVQVIIKSRGLHGPAFVQRFLVSDGSPKGRSPAFGDDLPDCAKPFEE